MWGVRFIISMGFIFMLVSHVPGENITSLLVKHDTDTGRLELEYSGKRVTELNGKAPLFILEEKGKTPLPVRDFEYLEKPSQGERILHGKAGDALEFREIFLTDRIDNIPCFRVKLKLLASREIEFILVHPFSIEPETRPVFLSPGYLYNTNNARRSSGKFPQLVYRGKEGTPESGKFYFRADRSSHSSVMALFDKKTIGLCLPEGVAIGETFHYNGLGIDTREEDFDILSLTIGYKNDPARYNGNCNPRISGRWEEKPDFGTIKLRKGEECLLEFLIYLGEAGDPFSYEEPLRLFYSFLREEPEKRADPDRVARLITGAILEDGVVEGCGMFRVIDKSDECDTGWTGGMMVAYPLFLMGRKKGHAGAYEAAVRAMDAVTSDGFNAKANMFYDAWKNGKWTVDGWWKNWAGGYHLAYNSGQASYFILRAYSELPSREKALRRIWERRSRDVVNQAVRMQRKSGEYPASFSPRDGSPGKIEGFGGCWFLPATLMMYRLEGGEEYLESARKAEAFYFDWLSTLEVWGTPIDAEGAVELEGNLPLVIGERLLHEITGEEKYLEHLAHAVEYDFTWKWAYNTHLENPPLGDMNWKSIGGNAASSCNIHLHPMSNMILGEISYLYHETDDDYYRQRLKDSQLFGLGCINLKDGDFGFGSAGWGTEQFFHTDAIQGQGPPDGGIWTRYLPWAAAAVLQGILSVPEEL